MSSDRLASFLGRAADVRADFGARADRNHDDSPNIQEALLEASQAGGGLVYVPPGTYKLGSALSFSGLNHVTLWLDVSATGTTNAFPASGAYGTNVVFRMGDAASGTVPVGSVGGSGGAGNGEITPGTVSGGGTTGGGDVTPGTVAGSGDSGAGDITVGTITGSGDAGDVGAGSATASGDLTGGSVSLADLTATLRRLLGFSRSYAFATEADPLRLSLDGGPVTPIGRWLDLITGSGVTLTLAGHHLSIAASGGGGGGWTLLEKRVLTADTAGTQQWAALSQAFDQLWLRVVARGVVATQLQQPLTMTVNNVQSAGAYSWVHHYAQSGGTHDFAGLDSDQVIPLGSLPNAGAAAGRVATVDLHLPAYAGTFVKTIHADSRLAADDFPEVRQIVGTRKSTAAITSIELYSSGVSGFAAGSTFFLYGL